VPRFVALDSLRGFCALAVALFHFPLVSGLAENGFIRHSYLFVDFFFVLSGFVIAGSAEGKLSGTMERVGFLLKRLGRLWPLHLGMLAVFIVAAVLKGEVGSDERHSLEAIATNVLMIHAWGVHHDLTWNDPSWSISVEWLLYLLFAGLSFVTWRRWLYAGLVLVGIGALFFFAPNGMGSTFDFGVARGLAGFFIGALITRMPLRPFGVWAEIAAVLGVAVFVGLGQSLFVAPFVFGAAVYVFAGSKGAIGNALRAKPFEWLGHRSYAIYMVHAAVVAALWAVSGPLGWGREGWRLDAGPWGDLIAVGYLVAVVALAALVTIPDDKCQKWVKAYANGLRRKPAMVPAE
jgi:peptidoglycan/LPS O-acetylase OafA/YrhL